MNCTVENGRYSAPMPWIGHYAMAASAACACAMLLDLLDGIRRRKLWFSCKYFALNATSLTLLAIATKLPFDFSTPKLGDADQLAKLIGTALLCISMGHFMPSIGAMEDSQVISNVVPLAILVITVIINVCIQMEAGVIHAFLPHHIITLAFMLIMLLITCSAALSIPNMKQLLKQQYELKCEQVSRESSELSSDEAVMVTFTRLKNDARKCWMMALSSHPQYVLRRSCLGVASDIVCILQACVMMACFSFEPEPGSVPVRGCIFSPDYKYSTPDLLAIQLFAVLLGALTPCLRTFSIGGLWSPPGKFNDDLSKESNGEIQVEKYCIRRLVGWKERLITGFGEFKISCMKRVLSLKFERYWIQSFVEWKESEIRLPLNLELLELIHLRRFIDHTKSPVLEVGRCLHILVVALCKLVLHLVLLLPLLSRIKIFMKQAVTKMKTKDSSIKESVDLPVPKRQLRHFVLHLEGEDGLVDWIFQSCYLDENFGSLKSMRYLIDLLKVSTVSQGFKGLAPLDSDHVRSAGSSLQEHPNFWALPLVTLTSIIAAIPCTKRARIRSLLSGVAEGLKYVRLVDTKLESEGKTNIREAADIIWQGVLLHHRWLDVDLAALARKQKDPNKIIEHLAASGNSYLVEFEKSMVNVREDKKGGMDWPPRVLAGISMHRICETIHRDYNNFSTDELFECLQVLLSDMLGACLTNLPGSLSLDCFSFSFEAKQGYSVWEAASLLGETEKILKALGMEGNQDPVTNQCKYIDYWRSFMLNPSTLPPISSGNASHDDYCLSME